MKGYELKFKNTNSIYSKLEQVEKKSGIAGLFYSVFDIYFYVKKELEKRGTNFRLCEYNNIFLANIELLTSYISENYDTSKLKKVRKGKLNKRIQIQGYTKLCCADKFNSIFDSIFLSHSRINRKKYSGYFKEKRQDISLDISNVQCVTKEVINSLNKLKRLKSNISYTTRKKKDKFINIYVVDLSAENFRYLFYYVSCIFRNSRFKIHICKDISRFKKLPKNRVNILMMYDSVGMDEYMGENKKNYILSKKNIYYDLFPLVSYRRREILNLETKLLDKKERKSLSNAKNYVSNRINELIELIEKEGDENQKFIDRLLQKAS